MNNTPTPRTDAAELTEPYEIRALGFCVVRIEFARQLERERNELVTALTKIAYDPTQSAEIAGRALNKLMHQLEQ
jgi:hypothetical protein